MRITLHGHRPWRSNAPGASNATAGAAPADAAQAGAVRNIHLGLVKLKIHRQPTQQPAQQPQPVQQPAQQPVRPTAQQMALLAQVQSATAGGTGPAPSGRPVRASAAVPAAGPATAPRSTAASPAVAQPAPQDPVDLTALSALLPPVPTGVPDRSSAQRVRSQGAPLSSPANATDLGALSALFPSPPTGIRPMAGTRHAPAHAQTHDPRNARPRDPHGLADLNASLPVVPSSVSPATVRSAVVKPEPQVVPLSAPVAQIARPPVPASTPVNSLAAAPRLSDIDELNALLVQWEALSQTRTAGLAVPVAPAAPTAPAVAAMPAVAKPLAAPARPTDPYRLDRFVQAQAPIFRTAMNELQRGTKQTHWMWFVFPQLEALGQSSIAKRYGLENLQEAQAYWAHPVLGPRLREGIRTMLQTNATSAEAVLGRGDAMKFQSCLTLFAEVDPTHKDIQLALARFYRGKPDELTQVLVRS